MAINYIKPKDLNMSCNAPCVINTYNKKLISPNLLVVE